MNIEERKDLQQELLEIVSNILVESEDSTIETMETRAVEIIEKLKKHINDNIECGDQRKTILDWVIACDSQGHVRLKNKSLLKFEKAIKDIGGRSQESSRGYVGNEREVFLNSHFFENVYERRARNYERLGEDVQLDHTLNHLLRVRRLSDRSENIVRQRTQEILNNIRGFDRTSEIFSGNRNENIRRSSERIRASYETIRPAEQTPPNYGRSREANILTKIRGFGYVVLRTMVGAYYGLVCGMVLADLCIELGIIITPQPLLLIMGATAVIGAIIAGTAPTLELIEMFKGQKGPNPLTSSYLENSNTEHAFLNRPRVI